MADPLACAGQGKLVVFVDKHGSTNVLFQFLQAFAKAYHWHIEPSGSLFETGTTCCCEKLYGQLIINWQIIQYVRVVRNNGACICFILCNH